MHFAVTDCCAVGAVSMVCLGEGPGMLGECSEQCLSSPSDVRRGPALEPSADAISRAISADFLEPDVLRRQ